MTVATPFLLLLLYILPQIGIRVLYSSIAIAKLKQFVTKMASSSSSTGSNRGRGGCRICYCSIRAVIRTAMTPDNYGRRFWGCAGFKYGDGCNFFRWVEDDNVGNNHVAEASNLLLIQQQRRRMMEFQIALRQSRRSVRIYRGLLFFSVVLNLLLMAIVWAICRRGPVFRGLY